MDYKRNHLPIGSDVTEAACKTVFTQRLKLSGMRWSHEGAGRILTLRVEEPEACALFALHNMSIRQPVRP